MKINIRKSTFEVIFKNVLTVCHCKKWEMYETDDKSKNPLITLQISKPKTLFKQIENWINKNRNFEFINASDLSQEHLEIGAMIGFSHLLYSELFLGLHKIF